MIKFTIILVLICFFLSGCSSLILQEKARALESSYSKGDISKVEYSLSKARLEQERIKLESKR